MSEKGVRLGEVIFNLPVNHGFTYALPPDTAVGVRVRAPFGSRQMLGAVVAVDSAPPSDPRITVKAVDRIVDRQPVFGQRELDLARWLADFYLCSQGQALFTMLPGGKRESDSEETLSFDDGPRPDLELSTLQQRAVEALLAADGGAHYLYGVTGSGKTEVFLRVAADVLEKGKGVIYLVPEISLVHQVVQTFARRFPGRIAVLHSALTPSQRLGEWMRVRTGEAALVIGARSAVFAPVPQLGLIVIDEEHEGAYKAGSTPRYHARQVAFHRAAADGGLLVLGSATPSVEAYHSMETGQISRLDLPDRPSGGGMPEVEIVDMRREGGALSARLVREIDHVRAEGRQTILLLNRRGFSYFFFCRSCGYEMTCRHCSVALTYHKSRERMICHYCGHSERPASVCPECRSYDIGYSGFGTEGIEEELRGAFPGLRVARLDTDTARRKHVRRDILRAFGKGEIDLLLGTQMVAKGLDFPGVKLVGVISADTGLQLPDFRALERTFSLIVQVSGRAGRLTPDGLVIVQTLRPETGVLMRAARNQAVEFYAEELAVRRQLRFPPFCRMIRLLVRGRDPQKVQTLVDALAAAASAPGVEVMGPAECPLGMIAGNHRWHVLLRGGRFRDVHVAARRALSGPRKVPGVFVEVDVDPSSLL